MTPPPRNRFEPGTPAHAIEEVRLAIADLWRDVCHTIAYLVRRGP